MSQDARLAIALAEGASPALVSLLRDLLACACTSSATGGADPDDLFASEVNNLTDLTNASNTVFLVAATVSPPASATGRYLVMAGVNGTVTGDSLNPGEIALFIDGDEHVNANVVPGIGGVGSGFLATLTDRGSTTIELRFRSGALGSSFSILAAQAYLIVTELEA